MPSTGVMPQVIFVEVARKRRWPWVLGIFGLLGMICCGLCAFALIPVGEQYPSKIAPMPPEVAGLQRDNNGAVRLVALAAADRIRLEWNIDDAFADNYVDPKSGKRNVITFGATLLVWNPGGDLDNAIKNAGQSISSVQTFPAGRMGGHLKCANGKDDKGNPVVVCAWIDHGSMGMNLCYGQRPMPECARFLRELREAIIVRP
jgi:hypothetical protein